MYKYVVRYKDYDGSYVYFSGFSTVEPIYNEDRGRPTFFILSSYKPHLTMDVTSAKMVRDLTGGYGEVVAVNEDGVIIG